MILQNNIFVSPS